MTSASTIHVPTLSPPPSPRRARAWVLPALSVLLLMPFLACAVVFAYCKLFTTFLAYDDEGYMMISLANFQKGIPLYDQVFTQYGPFYYWASWLVFKIAHLHLDHTSVRALTLLMWLVCSLLLASFTKRTTRSVALCIVVFVASFLHLGVLANEPGHPQGLACLLTLLAVVFAPLLVPPDAAFQADTAKSRVVPILLGALTTALAFTKTNLGVFLFLSLALLFLCLTLASSPTRSRLILALKVLLGLAIFALPTALMRTHLRDPSATWAQTYRLVTTLAAIPVLILILLPAIRPPAAAQRKTRLIPFLVSCGLTAIFLSAITLLRGTSLHGLAYGLVLMHIQFASIFFVPAPIPDFCSNFAYASSALFLVYLLTRFAPPLREILTTLLKLAFGLTAFVLALFPHVHTLSPHLDRLLHGLAPLGNYHHAGLLLGIVGPFLWVPLLPRINQSPTLAVSRLALVLIALLQTLMAYPVGGSQMAFATLLFLPAASLALSDVFSSLAGLVAPFPLARRAGLVVTFTLSSVTVLVTAHLSHLGTSRIYTYYISRPSVDLPGARNLHLDEATGSAFQWASYNIRQADTLFTFTGQNSFHFFSGTPSPTTLNCTMWPTQLTGDQQRAIIDSLNTPGLHPMVLQSAALTDNRPQYDGFPLVDYIKRTMVPRGTVLGFTLRTRPDWAPPLTYSAFLQPNEPTPLASHKDPDVRITLVLPAMPYRKPQILMICDLFKAGELAASPRADDRSLTVLDEAGRPIPLYATTIDLSTPRRLTLVSHAPNLWNDVEHAGFAVVRLFNVNSEPIGSIPVVHR